MIVKSNALFMDNDEENLPMDESAFPYLCLSAALQDYPGNAIAWHWHNAFEVNIVVSGQATFYTPNHSALLPAGAAIFINSNVLHSITGSTVQSLTHAHFFTGEFLAGRPGSVMESKYILPVLRSAGLRSFCLFPGKKEDAALLELITEASELSRNEPIGYELSLKRVFIEFWLNICKRYCDVLQAAQKRGGADDARMKEMLRFMQTHLGDRLSLTDIAGAASVSTRECTRCFIRTIGTAPVEYLNRLRLENAACRLTSTADSITAIAAESGFASGSYFSKRFKEKYGQGPREYRQSR